MHPKHLQRIEVLESVVTMLLKRVKELENAGQTGSVRKETHSAGEIKRFGMGDMHRSGNAENRGEKE